MDAGQTFNILQKIAHNKEMLQQEVNKLPPSFGKEIKQEALESYTAITEVIENSFREGRFSKKAIIDRYGDRIPKEIIEKAFTDCIVKLFESYAEFQQHRPLIEAIIFLNEIEELKERSYRVLRMVEPIALDTSHSMNSGMIDATAKYIGIIVKLSKIKIGFLQDIGFLPKGIKFGDKTTDSMENIQRAMLGEPAKPIEDEETKRKSEIINNLMRNIDGRSN